MAKEIIEPIDNAIKRADRAASKPKKATAKEKAVNAYLGREAGKLDKFRKGKDYDPVNKPYPGSLTFMKPAKRGTSTGYMTGGATEKKKVPKEYRGNTNSEGGIPFGKKPQ
jgi:hypothetical protein